MCTVHLLARVRSATPGISWRLCRALHCCRCWYPSESLIISCSCKKKKSSSVGSSRKRDAAAGSGNGGWCQTLRAPRPGAYADVFGVEFARTHARGAARLRDCFRVSVQIRAAAPAGHAVFWPAGFIDSFFLTPPLASMYSPAESD